MDLKVKDVILCDDIRIEQGNKFSLMGLYGDRVRITTKSDEVKAIRLSLSLMLRLEQPTINRKEYSFDLKIAFANQEMALVNGTFSFGDNMIASVPFNRLEFQFENSGELKFEFVIKDKNVKVLEHTETFSIEIIKPIPSNH